MLSTCNQTSYPHGTLPADRTYRFAETSDSECSMVCINYFSPTLDDEGPVIDRCNRIMNGLEGFDAFNPEVGRFNYVEAGMVCEPCGAVCTTGESSAGCNFTVGLLHCCIDGVFINIVGTPESCTDDFFQLPG